MPSKPLAVVECPECNQYVVAGDVEHCACCGDELSSTGWALLHNRETGETLATCIECLHMMLTDAHERERGEAS